MFRYAFVVAVLLLAANRVRATAAERNRVVPKATRHHSHIRKSFKYAHRLLVHVQICFCCCGGCA
jgi:hypothetical protein